jgi:SAM-dependent methyltransferase
VRRRDADSTVLATGRWSLKRPVADLLDRLGLLGPAFRTYEALLARDWSALFGKSRVELAADGLPLPPKELRVRSGPAFADAELFLESGRRHKQLVVDLLVEAGADPPGFDAVLDFGCGCGRVVRHWHGDGPAVHGSDLNPDAIRWNAANLVFAAFTTNELMPPLAHADDSFDLVWAFSVFTHLPADVQQAWLDELARVLKPGGWLLLSTQGEAYLDRLTAAERDRFRAGEQVVLYGDEPGTALCSAYTPPAYVAREFTRDFRHVSANVGAANGQDAHLLQRVA